MKKTIAVEVAEAIANGSERVVDGSFKNSNGEPIRVRSMESSYDPLEVGDRFTVPTTPEVLKMSINGSEEKYPYFFVEVVSSDGSTRNYRFFPNSLVKSVVPIIDGKRGPRVKTRGTATDLFNSKDTVDEALALLKGRTIVVASCNIVTVRDFNSKELRDTHIYEYNLA